MFSFSHTNRTHILAALVLIIMAVFVVRLFYLQVIRHDYYMSQADSEQIRQRKLPAERGEIYAMDGVAPTKLVLNETVYTVWGDPQAVKSPEKAIETIKRVAGGEIVDNARSLLDRKDTRYQVLAHQITSKQAQLIKKAELYGIGFERGERRVYPEGQLASQVLGFVDTEGEGQYGVEAELNRQLNGTDGLIKTLADVRDVPLTIGKDNINIPAKDGADIVLSIDRNVQSHAEETLAKSAQDVGAKYGSMLVMDPQTGRVLAMANTPTYDPSNISTISDYEQLNNRIVSRPYEPASVIKTLTMATGVDNGVMNPQSTYNNTDYITIDGSQIENYTKGQTGRVTMQHTLNWSLNTGTVTMAQWLGGGSINRKARDTMYSYFHDKFHLGETSGIEVSGEQPGILIPPSDPEGNAVRYANMTFGQGLTATPLQVASAFSTVINGGQYCRPTVLAGEMRSGEFVEADQKTCSQVIQSSTSSTMREMIYSARQEFYAGNDLAGFMVGGKTGTAEVAVAGGYDKESSEGTYIGFGGEKDGKPRYVILVTFARKGVKIGGQSAIPAFTDMSNWMINYLKLRPKG